MEENDSIAKMTEYLKQRENGGEITAFEIAEQLWLLLTGSRSNILNGTTPSAASHDYGAIHDLRRRLLDLHADNGLSTATKTQIIVSQSMINSDSSRSHTWL